MKELTIEAIDENLDAVLEFVGGELDAADCPIKIKRQIFIAVEEIFINIANYAYSPEVGSAVIRVCAGSEAVIEFEDTGKPYNPLEKNDPNIDADAEERELGGCGIFMVKNLMDVVEYRHVENKNILLIKKMIL